jgi:molybdopterin/thiamine biosynthesis adenylyltransferase
MGEKDRLAADLRVAVIGLGGIGCALFPRLLRMPFSVITLVDGDRVEAKNLERQELYAPVDVGRAKVDVAAAWARNAPVSPLVEPQDAFMDHQNAEPIIAMHDVVVDCTDDLHVRRLIDRTCRDLGVLLISGSVHSKQGQVVVLHDQGENEELTLAELFAGRPSEEQDGCDMRQVPSRVLEETAKRMAWRVREWLNGVSLPNGRIDVYDSEVDAWIELAPPTRA